MSNIITSSQVIDRTGADTSTADLIADAINQQIETLTGRYWGGAKTVTEVYDAQNVLWLNQMDISAVSSIKVGHPNQTRTTLETGSYSFNKYGRVVLSYAPMTTLPPLTSDYIEVAYTYGVPAEEVPADLILAALSMASSYYTYAIEHGGSEVSEEGIGSYSVKYVAESGSDGKGSTGKSRDLKVVNTYAKRRV